MASLIDYHGLQLVSPDPTGDGGLAIQDNFKSLVDWNPKGVWNQSTSPTATDDGTQEYFPGSLWLRTDTTPSQLFVCKSSATAAASWLPILLNVVQDTSPKLGGDLDVNGHKIKDTSAVTITVSGNSVATVTSSTVQIQGNALIGTTTTPTGATFNIAIGGGSTSPVLGSATSDIVSIAAVDKAAGDRRLYIQSEGGSPISIGNDRLNFGAASGAISIGGIDTLSIGSGGIAIGAASRSNNAVYAFASLTNTNNTASLVGQVVTRTTTNMSNSSTGFQGAVNVTVADGIANSGSIYGGYMQVLRSLDNQTDNGTLSTMYGNIVIVGHNAAGRSYTSPLTTNCYGVAVIPNALRGTITNLYSLYIGSAQGIVTPPVWATTTAYPLNSVVQPSVSNSRYFVCTTAGTSGSNEPTWNTTTGSTTSDGTAVWTTILIPSITNLYGVFQADSNAQNIFGGTISCSKTVGVGVNPSATIGVGVQISSASINYGVQSRSLLTPTADTGNNCFGVTGFGDANGNFNFTNASGSIFGVQGTARNILVTSATITRAIGVAGAVQCLSTAGGVVTNANSFYAVSPVIQSGGGTISTAVGLYISQQKITGVTTGYGVYQANINDKNYFSGPSGFGSMTAPVYPVHAQSSNSGNAIFVDRVGTGAGNGQVWSLGILNSAANDIFGLGCSSSTFTTGGNLAWLGNSECYLYFPSANGFKIGTTTGSGGAILAFSSTALAVGVKFSKYNAITTAGGGIPAIYGYGRLTAQSAAAASVATYTVGANDASFLIWSNVLVYASTSHSFSVTCAYTDESNTARTLTMTFSNSGGTLATTISNTSGVGPYSSLQSPIRAKTGTTITVSTTGTFTTVTYNVEAFIAQVS